MATTKDRLDELTRPARLEGQPHDREAAALERALEHAWVATGAATKPTAASNAPVAAASREPLGARLLKPITGRWAAIGAVAWAVLLPIGIAVEPPPSNPNAVDPWLVNLLATVLLVALLGAVAGFWLRRRWSMAASLLAAGILVFSTVMCPVSGHHTHVGAWWVVQLGCGLGLVTTSSLGLRRGQGAASAAIHHR
jgi:peptidoglycan/LPS O-acetylase OafA/YrhL